MTLSLVPQPNVASHLRPLRYKSTAVTHAGCVRRYNEDACLNRPEVGLWAVADGMGGHHAGDVASSIVIAALDRVAVFESAFAFRRAVRGALFDANTQLQQKAAEQLVDIMGSTVVALLAHGGHYACVWAGDSRAYLWRGGKLEQVTRDHNLVEELIESGQLPAAHESRSKKAHVVTRAVGARQSLELDGVYGRMLPGDRFLVCSDGLAVLEDKNIAALLAKGDDLAAARALLQQALAAGAPDNVSAIVIDTAACIDLATSVKGSRSDQ